MPYAMTAALIICTLSFALFALFALAGYKAFYLGESTSVSKTCGSTASQSKQCIPCATVTCASFAAFIVSGAVFLVLHLI